MKIIINQPRTSYFVGGAEMISIDHAINLYNLKNDIYFFTINPKSINMNYSVQYKKFYAKYKDLINFIEIDQSERIIDIYKIQPGEDRTRWNVESISYNQELYRYIDKGTITYDVILSYYNLDACFIPHDKIKNNILYLCGIPKEQNDFQGSFLYCYDKVIAISEEVKKSWEKYSKNNIPVISTGVDCKRFFPSEEKNNDKIKMLYVGRLISRKNVACIINVFESLKNTYNLELTIVGDGPNRVKLENMSKNVKFTGVVTNTEEYYRDADIFVSPSSYGEGLQGTILEAMSSGLTVVATDTRINKELLDNGRGFCIFPDEESLTKGIINGINANRKKISKESRNYILKNYDWITKARELMEEMK